jgi:type VI secretion system ImpM family protein
VSPRLDSGGAPAIGAFGKVPYLGDFVRLRTGVAAMRALEDWVTEGMAIAEARRHPDWAQRYAVGSVNAFVFRVGRGREATLLAGILQPSRDAAGRLFPIVVGAPMAEGPWQQSPHLLPMLLGDFLEGAAEAAGTAAQARTQEQFEQQTARVAPPRWDHTAHVQGDFARWSAVTAAAQTWSIVFGAGATDRAPEVLATLIECVAPLRGQEDPSTPLSVKLPLGTGGVAAASYWLHVIRSISRWRTTVPTTFWSFDDYSGTLLVQLGSTPVRTVGELWNPDASDDHVCDLTQPPTRPADPHRALARLPVAVAQVLTSPDATVDHLIAALAR